MACQKFLVKCKVTGANAATRGALCKLSGSLSLRPDPRDTWNAAANLRTPRDSTDALPQTPACLRNGGQWQTLWGQRGRGREGGATLGGLRQRPSPRPSAAHPSPPPSADRCRLGGRARH